MALICALKLSACFMLSIASPATQAQAEHGTANDNRYALGTHAGSHYDPALLYDESGGVPNDLNRQRVWSGWSGARLKVANLILAQLEPITSEKRAMAAPEGVETNTSPKGDRWQIDLVWTALPGPPGSLFVVELVTIPSASDGESELVAFEQTEATATTAYVDRVPVGLALRVSQVAADGSEYAAGVWTELSPGPDGSKAETALAPVGRVTIRVGTTDIPARQLARDLAIGLGAGGVWVHLEEVELDQTESSVAYRYAADAELASSVAGYLPVLGPENAIRRVELASAPGEVVVTLVGGPTVVDDAD